jgi:uncharacterized protein
MRAALRNAMMAALIATAGAGPATAQFSNTYTFFQAVKDRDVMKAKGMLDRPGSTVADQRDPATGGTALHLVTQGRDIAWMNFLMSYGASPNAHDRDGNTPLHIAAQLGFGDGILVLTARGADANAANQRGETPLIVAVQMHDAGSVRTLLEAGADPSIADHVTGKNARDYASADRRDAALLKLIDQVKPRAAKTFTGPR